MKPISEAALREEYDEVLFDIHGDIKICGNYYDAGRAFMLVDPIAYNCSFNDWLDAQCSDGVYVERDGEYYRADECGAQ